jgi:hypothetical protein
MTTHSRPLHRTLAHIELGPIISIESGHPVNALKGSIRIGAVLFPFSARVLGFKRNTLGTPAPANVDIRVLKYFALGKASIPVPVAGRE